MDFLKQKIYEFNIKIYNIIERLKKISKIVLFDFVINVFSYFILKNNKKNT